MNLPQIALTLVVGVLPIVASASDTSHHSAYAGQETRVIKSLSAGDIAELRRGGGWGLAKTAELNGLPGPTHLLEMRNEIALDDAQIAAVEEIYERMQAAAIAEGEKLISLEEELERHFRSGTITEEILSASLDAIAVVLKDLRYIHLSAHLQTPDILSAEQIANYNTLRGYTASEPCANIPAGHDAAMWRKHNGCE